MIRWLLVGCLVLVGCSSHSQPADVQFAPTLPVGISKITKTGFLPIEESENTIKIFLIIFIIDDQQQVFSSERKAAEVIEIQSAANTIWEQAGIQFEISEIRRVTVPLDMTGHVIRRQFDDFFEKTVDFEQYFESSSPISAFYVQTVKGDNGLQPNKYKAYFVADETLNDPGRTVAHELGHVLGLGHVRNDPTRLMHSGSNGVILTSDEIALARKNGEALKR